MSNINDIYQMLNCHSRLEDQLQGIKLAREIDDLSLLIIPYADGESKALWDNCAKALFELSDDRLEPHLPSLLEWIQDINWPGALIILNRLKVFAGKKLRNPFIDRVTYVSSLNNEEGLMWLDYLSELLDNKELKAELPIEMIDKLQNHYHNWSAWYND
ncbi:MAG: DUF5071 domain-containing protein [Eubacteriales bacterium]